MYGVEACSELLPRGVLFVQELVAEGTPVVMVRGLSSAIVGHCGLEDGLAGQGGVQGSVGQGDTFG